MNSLAILIVAVAIACIASATPANRLALPPMPLRLPVASTAASTYAVPASCGIQLFTGTTSTWTLPLSYTNGGNTSTGELLWVRNAGSGSITVNPVSPDTIRGGALTVATTNMALLTLSGNQWVVLSTAAGLP